MSSAELTPIERVLRRIDATTDGAPVGDTVPTGFPSVDAILGGGMRRSDLIVLGGDVGSGKSAFALGVAMRVAAAGQRVAILTAEAREDRVIERALCIEGRVRMDALRSGRLDDEARTAVGAAALQLRDAPLTIHELYTDNVADAAPRVPTPSLIVVDALQSLAPGRRPIDDELAAAVRALKAVARERGSVVLLVAQLTTAAASRPDPRPVLADFGALGAVGHHADVVLALHRDPAYAAAASSDGPAELLVRKNRDGALGYADLYFRAPYLRFEDLLDPER